MSEMTKEANEIPKITRVEKRIKLKTVPSFSTLCEIEARGSTTNLHTCSVMKQNYQSELNVCAVSTKAPCATYLYTIGQKLPEHSENSPS